MSDWKTLSRKPLLQVGSWLTVESHSVRAPNGVKVDDWAWVTAPDYAIIVPVTRDLKVFCFDQKKYAIQEGSLSFPGGHIEKGEAPLESAKRELQEEAGFISSQWLALGSFVVDGNRGFSKAHLFLAKDIQEVGKLVSDDLEIMSPHWLSLAEMEAALLSSKFKALSWAAAGSLALHHLK